jgi:deazaflavin-dependent oxidoreductase (nitroreductase family)
MAKPNEWNNKVIAEFRANGGQVGGQYDGRSLLLLHTTGARTGAERVTPLSYFRDGDRLVVLAARAGAPNHPDWYHNLLAHPQVTVEVGADKF